MGFRPSALIAARPAWSDSKFVCESSCECCRWFRWLLLQDVDTCRTVVLWLTLRLRSVMAVRRSERPSRELTCLSHFLENLMRAASGIARELKLADW